MHQEFRFAATAHRHSEQAGRRQSQPGAQVTAARRDQCRSGAVAARIAAHWDGL